MLNNIGKVCMITVCVSCLALSGCATVGSQLFEGPKKTAYSFDLSNTNDKGVLVISSTGDEIQTLLQYHIIRVDDGAPLQISKYSEVEIILDAGDHKFEIYGYSTGTFLSKDGVFGYKNVESFRIGKGETIKYSYRSPCGMLLRGNLRKIKISDDK